MIKIYIGPNGYGKTTQLRNEEKQLISSGIIADEILFLESELLLSDEIKDTKDSTKTMEYITAELLSTPAVRAAKIAYEAAVDNEINSNISNVNKIMDDILLLNGSSRTKDVISTTAEKEYKKFVSINKKDFTEKMGSGQRMQFILSLVKNSSKKYIFLDEPEKYSHPSLLNRTASIIRDLEKMGKSIYIATHSAKLVSMLNFDISKSLFLINDNTHNAKSIPVNDVIVELLSKNIPISNFSKKEKELYSTTQCNGVIGTLFFKEFLESLFSKKVYICEGINDANFIKKFLIDNSAYYDDYFIFPVYGKYSLPFFLLLYNKLDIETCVTYDYDNPANNNVHKWIDDYLENNSLHHYAFTPNIEKELLYTGDKSNIYDFWEHLCTMTLSVTKYNTIL